MQASSTYNSQPSPELTIWPSPSLEAKLINAPNSHSHYATRKVAPPFFEGWYLRLTLPNSDKSYAFIFAVEADGKGTMQLYTPDDNNHCVELHADKSSFFGSKNSLNVNHWGYSKQPETRPPIRSSSIFDREIMQGYKLSATSSHGSFRSSAASHVQWSMDYMPLLTWGARGTTRDTATWLGRLSIFEPGYQVLIAHGAVREGYILCNGVKEDVTGAVVYCEKNWGKSFPSRWWWIQANGFWDIRDLTFLAVGARRKVLGQSEIVGMIAVHYQGRMFEFANWNCESVDWQVAGWGSWKATSVAQTGHFITFESSTNEPPVDILGPSENGLIYNVRDCSRGYLKFSLKAPDGQYILEDVQCRNAQVEVGGDSWEDDWVVQVKPMPWALRTLVNWFNGPKVETST